MVLHHAVNQKLEPEARDSCVSTAPLWGISSSRDVIERRDSICRHSSSLSPDRTDRGLSLSIRLDVDSGHAYLRCFRNAVSGHPVPLSPRLCALLSFISVFTRLPTRYLRDFCPALLLVTWCQRDVNGEACALFPCGLLPPALQPLWRSTISSHHGSPMPRCCRFARACPASARAKSANTICPSGVRSMPVFLHADGRHDVAALHAHGKSSPLSDGNEPRSRDEVGGLPGEFMSAVAQYAHRLAPSLYFSVRPESATTARVRLMPAISSPILTTSFFMGASGSKRESFKMASTRRRGAAPGVHGFQAFVGLEHAVQSSLIFAD